MKLFVFLAGLGACLVGCPSPPSPSPVSPPDATIEGGTLHSYSCPVSDGGAAWSCQDGLTTPVGTCLTYGCVALASSETKAFDCAAACEALKAAGCPVGAMLDCGSLMMRDTTSGKWTNVASGKPLACADVAAVKTKADAQKLGFVCSSP
jgi:hypothetical protein